MRSSSPLILIAGNTPDCFVQKMARSRRFISSIIFIPIPCIPVYLSTSFPGYLPPCLPSGYQVIPFRQQSFHLLRRNSCYIPFGGVSQGAQRVAEIQRILEIVLFQETVKHPGEEGIPTAELVDHFEFEPPPRVDPVSL